MFADQMLISDQLLELGFLTEEEKAKRLNVRRSVYLDEDVDAGQRLRDAAVKFKRPGFGMSPVQYEEQMDKVFNKVLPAGSLLNLEDLS